MKSGHDVHQVHKIVACTYLLMQAIRGGEHPSMCSYI